VTLNLGDIKAVLLQTLFELVELLLGPGVLVAGKLFLLLSLGSIGTSGGCGGFVDLREDVGEIWTRETRTV
jgi:hypothetical protein